MVEQVHAMRLTTYTFSLDKGPDNQGCFRRIRNRVRCNKFTSVVWVHCLLHQPHLIAKDYDVANAESEYRDMSVNLSGVLTPMPPTPCSAPRGQAFDEHQ